MNVPPCLLFRWLSGTSLLACLCGLIHAQTLQELLDDRPAFPEIPWAQELDESPAQRHARIAAWELRHAEWLQDMAKFQGLAISPQAASAPPGVPGEAPRFAPSYLLADFSSTGDPIYLQSENAEAAVTTHAHTLRDGIPGLDGANEIAAVWDAGAVRETHVEFRDAENQSRVRLRESMMNDSHATHMAGTIAAAGINEGAKGMAPAARIESWDWGNVLSEVIAPSDSDPKRFGNVANDHSDFDLPSVSNHSYGSSPTWAWELEPRQQEWYWPGTLNADLHRERGVYEDSAQRQDSTAIKTPFHLFVRSAGNYRQNGPQPGDTFRYRSALRISWQSAVYDPAIHPASNGDAEGGYFTINARALAKNVLTVGNYTDSFSGVPLRDPNRPQASQSTSWGPTRCGRIKPDLVATGTDLFSTDSPGNAAYTTQSGTSMAAPSVTGSILLLQQAHRALNLSPNRRLAADELKGLLIHTCDDIESPGPDYRSGFGLINAVAAHHVMLRARSGNPAFLGATGTVSTNGGPSATATHSVSLERITPSALKATLVWFDPPGTVQDPKDHGITLVNDLDLRIIDPKGNTYLPFVLDPRDPAGLASPGDNIRDNVEQVIFPNAPNGTYTIQVSCKSNGTIGTQRYAVWVSPVTDALAVEQLAIEIPASGTAAPLRVRSDIGARLLPGAPWVITPDTLVSGEQNLMVGALWNTSPHPRESTAVVRSASETGEIEVRVTQRGATGSSSIPLATGIGEPSLAFTTTPGAAWEGIRNFLGHSGDLALSPLIGNNEASWIRHQFTGPGAVTFDHQVSSEANRDLFSFNSIIGGMVSTHLQRSGIHNWAPFSITFDTATTRTLEWRYQKDSSLAEGNDRALVRHLKIHRLLPGAASVSLDAPGLPANFSWTMTHPNSWQIRNPSPWVLPADTDGSGNGSSRISALRNHSPSPRFGSFEIGSTFLGFHTIQVTQNGSSQIPIADVTAPAGMLPSTPATGWIGISGAGKNGTSAIAISDHPTGPSAAASFTRTGPGVLYFHSRLDHSEGDIASIEVNGDFTNLASFPPAPDAWRPTAIYLPESTNTITFRHTHGGHPASPNSTALSAFEFLPGSFTQEPPLVPASGGTTAFSLQNFGPESWKITPQPSDESPLTISSNTGTGDATITATLGPDTLRLGADKSLHIELGDRPAVRIPLLQQKTAVFHIATGLDLPPGVTATVTSPSPSRIIGQTALTADGFDAIVLGHHIGHPETLTLQFPGPAILTVDFRYSHGVSPAPGFNAHLNNILIGDVVFPSTTWNTLAVHHHFSGIHQLAFSKKSNDSRYVYLDRVRIEPIPASWQDQTRVVDPAAGSLILPGYFASGETPILVSDPAFLNAFFFTDPRTGNRLLRINHTALPAGAGGRSGWVDAADRRLHLIQLRESAIDSGYLSLAGVADSDDIRHNPNLHPFAYRPNAPSLAFAHAFSLDWPQTSALPKPRFANGSWDFDFATRPSNNLTEPLIELSTDLATWHRSRLVAGEWTQPPGFLIERRADGNSTGSLLHTHGLTIRPANPATPRLFIRQAAGFAN